MAFLFLPYFQHISIFQNTNVLPQNTAKPQYPTGCIINDQERERELPFTTVLSPTAPVLATPSQKQLRRLLQVAVPCESLRGPRTNLIRKDVSIPAEICVCLAPFTVPLRSPPTPLKTLALLRRSKHKAPRSLFFFPVLYFFILQFSMKSCPPHLQPVGGWGGGVEREHL